MSDDDDDDGFIVGDKKKKKGKKGKKGRSSGRTTTTTTATTPTRNALPGGMGTAAGMAAAVAAARGSGSIIWRNGMLATSVASSGLDPAYTSIGGVGGLGDISGIGVVGPATMEHEPRPPKDAYQIFLEEKRDAVMREHPEHSPMQALAVANSLWMNATMATRMHYAELEAKEQARYNLEMATIAKPLIITDYVENNTPLGSDDDDNDKNNSSNSNNNPDAATPTTGLSEGRHRCECETELMRKYTYCPPATVRTLYTTAPAQAFPPPPPGFSTQDPSIVPRGFITAARDDEIIKRRLQAQLPPGTAAVPPYMGFQGNMGAVAAATTNNTAITVTTGRPFYGGSTAESIAAAAAAMAAEGGVLAGLGGLPENFVPTKKRGRPKKSDVMRELYYQKKRFEEATRVKRKYTWRYSLKWDEFLVADEGSDSESEILIQDKVRARHLSKYNNKSDCVIRAEKIRIVDDPSAKTKRKTPGFKFLSVTDANAQAGSLQQRQQTLYAKGSGSGSKKKGVQLLSQLPPLPQPLPRPRTTAFKKPRVLQKDTDRNVKIVNSDVLEEAERKRLQKEAEEKKKAEMSNASTNISRTAKENEHRKKQGGRVEVVETAATKEAKKVTPQKKSSSKSKRTVRAATKKASSTTGKPSKKPSTAAKKEEETATVATNNENREGATAEENGDVELSPKPYRQIPKIDLPAQIKKKIKSPTGHFTRLAQARMADPSEAENFSYKSMVSQPLPHATKRHASSSSNSSSSGSNSSRQKSASTTATITTTTAMAAPSPKKVKKQSTSTTEEKQPQPQSPSKKKAVTQNAKTEKVEPPEVKKANGKTKQHKTETKKNNTEKPQKVATTATTESVAVTTTRSGRRVVRPKILSDDED